MATDAPSTRELDERLAADRVQSLSSGSLLQLLLPLASLKLTVVLFALATFLVLAGTLAQVEMDVWEVVSQYFRTWVAWIDFQVFFPQAFTGTKWNVPGSFPFPGGFALGTAMMVNLLAAHALRFKIQARGSRLWAGLAVIVVGAVLLWMVVATGSGKAAEAAAGTQWSLAWTAMKFTLAALWGAAAYMLWKLEPGRGTDRWLLIGFLIIFGPLVGYLFVVGAQTTFEDSVMRILSQVIKGELVALVLLAGSVLVFRKRAGIVLLHAGVMLIMANEIVVWALHDEGQMTIREGQTVNFAEDIRTVELAIVDSSDPDTDDVVVVPQEMLAAEDTIRDDDLPFDVEVDEYLQNSELVRHKEGDKNLATKGFGLKVVAEPKRAGTGTDTGGKVDLTAAYVTLYKKGTKDTLGTYLVGVAAPPQDVEVGDKTYDLALRFKRDYKPYSIRLDDVRADMYLGTNTPKNYSSDIRLVDPSREVDRDIHIWMNNPLRYGGETFYQQSYDPGQGGREITVLSVVANFGWMIPYVACMIVGTGMFAQFSITLTRFVRRREEMEQAPQPQTGRRIPVAEPSIVPVVLVALVGVSVLAMAWPRPVPADKMKLDEFGNLPVVSDGRVKPIDSLARGTLKSLSGKQTFKDEAGNRQSAVKWFLDTVASPQVGREHKVIQIYDLDLLDMLGLERREGFRYSIDEFADKLPELQKQVEQASALEASELTNYQRRLLELAKKLQTIRRLEMSFEPPQLRQDHAQEDIQLALRQLQALEEMSVPLVVPPGKGQDEWSNFASSWFTGLKQRVQGEDPNPAMIAMTKLIVAYDQGDVEAFNTELAEYQNYLADNPPDDYEESKVRYEAFYNALSPLFWAWILYLGAFLLAALSWLGWSKSLNRAAFCMAVLAVLFHTVGLVSRIYISGRPPVTNLYSSAVFIGWAGVLAALGIERVYRLGVGNVVAAVAGFVTLAIAIFGLDDGGDTLGVMQAVLDTQFWLATHVVCITLGYATTYLAGLFGVIYILGGVLTPSLTPNVGKDISRMVYGMVCFAMFFSFVGTVLGGLWADDSWGRFWGWDPKENGALMIVLWNALILHARWGAMIKERGLAALAVGGNIVTTWSYFGTNELGVGLHSYGFTEGVLLWLAAVVLVHLAIIGLALIPKRNWWSTRAAG